MKSMETKEASVYSLAQESPGGEQFARGKVGDHIPRGQEA
jgi:hypothetical protein